MAVWYANIYNEEKYMSNMITCSCISCKRVISTSNIEKHYKSKSCTNNIGPFVKLTCCKYCSLSFESLSTSERANHSQWCNKNPKRTERSHNLQHARDKRTQESFKKQAMGVSKAHKDGRYVGSAEKAVVTKRKNGTVPTKENSPEWYNNVCESARKSQHQRVCKRTHEFTDKQGRVFKFDSTWEDALAIRLDELDITWDRPAPIQYNINGVTKNYFPDFYLPDYNTYIDPKNTYVITQQEEKIKAVSSLIHLIILNSLESCKTFTI